MELEAGESRCEGRSDIISSARAADRTPRASGPMVSRLRLSGKTPVVSTEPMVGLNPTTPQRDAGTLIEPPVSLPTAQSHMPAATAAADPPDDPPGIRSGSCGLRTAP